MENTGKVLLTSIHGLVGQQHLISHSESGSSGCLLWSARDKDQSREILKSTCCSNKGTQLQTKGGISDGTLRVTYYDSRGFVSCNFIFHVADPSKGVYNRHVWFGSITNSGKGCNEHCTYMASP